MQAGRDKIPIATGYIAACINELKAPDAIYMGELGVPGRYIDHNSYGTYIGSALAGGLGLGLGAALGAKLGAPDREVIVSVGDGSYMFGNPLPYHFVQRAENLPTLTIIANNRSWHAVRQATLAVHPKGKAAAANRMPLVDLTPSPDYEKTIETCGGLGIKVETPDELMPAMKRCFEAVRSGTPALMNVLTAGRL